MNARPQRIIVTGARDWTDHDVIHHALFEHAQFGDTLVSGACPTGADAVAEQYWQALGPIERHPADWYTYGKAAGPRRNQEMVDLGADICLAFIGRSSRGTIHCANAAEKAGIPVLRWWAE